MVPCFPLLGLTPSGLFMGLSGTIIYTSELILCSTICVPSATRHNIHMLELIYACNAVDHIMTGKAISRAVRAHLIVDAALNALLYSQALEVPVPHLTEEGGIVFL